MKADSRDAQSGERLENAKQLADFLRVRENTLRQLDHHDTADLIGDAAYKLTILLACIREQQADAVMLIEAGMPHNFKYGYVTVRVPK